MDPTEINPLDLPSLPLTDRKQLPTCSAIYFVIGVDGEVLYIGKAKNLSNRWVQHHRHHQLRDIDGVKLAWMDCPTELLIEVELALIEWFSPRLNDTPCIYRGMSEVVPKIAELREKAGITQRELANALGVTDTTIANWERGRRSLEWIVWTVKLCERLNCEPSDLYEEKGAENEVSSP